MNRFHKYPELRNTTIPRLLLERAWKTPLEVALRAKKLGIYKERTWSDLFQRVACCAMGLAQLELTQGERLAWMGDPCEEHVICELAAHTLGAITYAIYPASSTSELLYFMKDGRASIFVAQNQEYLDRIFPLLDQLSGLRHIIIIDTRGMFGVNYPTLTRYEKLLQIGEKSLASSPRAFEEMARRVNPSDGIFIVYTSGATGPPKGVLISHGKHLTAVYTLIDRYPILEEEAHRTVPCIPLSHIFGKVMTITLPLLTRIVPHYGEDMETLEQTMFDVAPTALFFTPKYLRKLASRLFVSMGDSSPLKRISYSKALKIGRRHLENVWDGKRSLGLRLSYFICHHVTFRPILNKLGFNKLKIVFSTGAFLPTEIMAFWQTCGINLSEFYGLTEAGGAVVSAQGPHFPRPGNVGKPASGWEVQLSDHGEVLVRGDDLFEAYWNHPRLKGEGLSPDGWFRTGDGGEWGPDGNLKLLDRPQDLYVTLEGRRVSPTYIESNLKTSPYISEAVVFGDSRPYLTALIEIEFGAVSDWANRNHILFTSFKNLVEAPEISKFMGTEIEKANNTLSPQAQIKAFRILPTELTSAENGSPVSPTGRIKRGLLYNQFKELVESMYHHKTD